MNDLERIRMAQVALSEVEPLFRGRLNLGPRFEPPEIRTKLALTLQAISDASSDESCVKAIGLALDALVSIWPLNYTWLTGDHHRENLHNALHGILSETIEKDG